MNSKDFYKIFNQVAESRIAFSEMSNMALRMERLRKMVYPNMSAYCNLLPKWNIMKAIATPKILQIAQRQQNLINQIAPQLKFFSEQQEIFNIIKPQIVLVSEAMQPYLAMQDLIQKYDFGAISKKMG